MKSSLIAIAACCAVAGSAFALSDSPGSSPPHFVRTDSPGSNPPHFVRTDSPGSNPPHLR